MRKTMRDLAIYLKAILPPETDAAYAVHPALAAVAPEADIRAGVRAFRAFLCRLFNVCAVARFGGGQLAGALTAHRKRAATQHGTGCCSGSLR